MVVGSAISKRVRAEEVAVCVAEATLALVLVVLVTARVEDGLLATDANHEPIPPDVTFDTEADLATDVAALVPSRIFVVLGVVGGFTRFVVDGPVVSLQLIPDEVDAQPEGRR